MAEVVIQEGESLENALRRFKRKVQSEDIIKEIKKHSYYMKPGEKRRAKEALSRKRLRKKQRREQDVSAAFACRTLQFSPFPVHSQLDALPAGSRSSVWNTTIRS